MSQLHILYLVLVLCGVWSFFLVWSYATDLGHEFKEKYGFLMFDGVLFVLGFLICLIGVWNHGYLEGLNDGKTEN